jgi:hypothetical protein
MNKLTTLLSTFFLAALVGCDDAKKAQDALDTQKATEQGDAAAQNNLGVKYANGDGVPKDSVKAVECYRKAAEKGNAYAQHNLGLMYYNGEGVPKDTVSAYMYWNLASATESKAAEARDEIAKEMTRDQITEAQRLTREWKPTAQPK